MKWVAGELWNVDQVTLPSSDTQSRVYDVIITDHDPQPRQIPQRHNGKSST